MQQTTGHPGGAGARRLLVALAAMALTAAGSLAAAGPSFAATASCKTIVHIATNSVINQNTSGVDKCYRVQARATQYYSGGSTALTSGPISAVSSTVTKNSGALGIVDRRARVRPVSSHNIWSSWWIGSATGIHNRTFTVVLLG